jgi:hypothetical protein
MIAALAYAVSVAAAAGTFTLAGPGVTAQIWVGSDEPAYVRKAAEDLIADIAKIVGSSAPRLTFAASFETCASPCVVLASVSVPSSARYVPAATAAKLRGKWEAYDVAATDAAAGGATGTQRLLIAGSDPRGTMFGLYAFIEQRLGVDPLYFWTGREPASRAELSWPAASLTLSEGEPSVKYRGWFVNDEDLLTEWKDSGGRRELDYPYYSQVVAADVADRVFEAMVRLRMNLVIPASFIDILNPPEAALVERARARGLYLSMHHVEPMGVSGFTFQNYWKARGKTPKFSFYSSRAELEEVWRVYAAAWAKQPDVIWQIGLRGIADRPMWMADPSIPQSDVERGRLISEAMAVQMRIIAEVDRRPRPPVTTTLWAEGAFMQADGHLKIPAGVTVVFSDNSPGWKLQRDFFEAPREAGRDYGIYYHHQLWSAGPHLVQAVPPAKTHEILTLAMAKNAASYVVLNVGNVREFALGLDASARMLRDLRGFAPGTHLASWCADRFGAAAGAQTCAAYRALFDSYAISGETGTPMLMDGQTIAAGLRTLDRLERRRAGTTEVGRTAEQKASAEWGARALSDTNPAARMDDASLLKAAAAQRAKLDEAVALGERARNAIKAGPARDFFEANFAAQAGIHRGLTAWLEQMLTASLAEARGDRQSTIAALTAGRAALRAMRDAQRLATRGKFADWYRGDKKMRLSRAEDATDKALAALAEKSAR